jgi:hypothetical protein
MPLRITSPLPYYAGSDGRPLTKAHIYFGAPNRDPREHPVAVYYDEWLTEPAAQPLRTRSGYLLRDGRPTNVWSDTAYSTLVVDATGLGVHYSPTSEGAMGAGMFRQDWKGAVLRRTEDKMQELNSIADAGAVGDGTANMRREIEVANVGSTGVTKLLMIPEGTYVSNDTTVANAQTFLGDGGELISTAAYTVGTLIVGNRHAPTTQTDPVHFYNMRFRWTVAPADDNRAVLNVLNTPVTVIGGFWSNTATAVRIGHINAGNQATAENSAVIGLTGKGVSNFGIEQIGSGFSRVLGIGLYNDGVQSGMHGVRWAGFAGNVKRGNVLVGSVIRDRGSEGGGLSIQAFQENGAAVGNVFDNCPYGILVNSGEEIEGRHMLAGNVIRGATKDGADLNYLSGSVLHAVVDRPRTVGVRNQVKSNGNRIDVVVHGGESAWRGGGESHLVDIIANQQLQEPVTIACDYSCVRIVVRGSARSQPILIRGSHNVVTVVDGDGHTASIHIESSANHNVLIAQTKGDVQCDGTGNTLHLQCAGHLIVNGRGNAVLGVAAAYTDNGVLNDFRGATGASAHGSTVTRTDPFGVAQVAHGLLVTPRVVRASARAMPILVSTVTVTSTTISFAAWGLGTGARLQSSPITIDWDASY